MRAWTRLLIAIALLVVGCSPTADGPVREIQLTTSQFAYDPPEIVLKQGERVRLTVVTTDVTHGFGVLEWNLNRQVLPGQPLVLDLKPERPGRYQIVCTVFCGTGHGEHKGTIVVQGR